MIYMTRPEQETSDEGKGEVRERTSQEGDDELDHVETNGAGAWVFKACKILKTFSV